VELCLNSHLPLREVNRDKVVFLFCTIFYFVIEIIEIIKIIKIIKSINNIKIIKIIKNIKNIKIIKIIKITIIKKCDESLANFKKFRVHLKKLIVPQLLKIFPEFLQKPKFRYRVHRRPTIVPILCQINPDCAFTTDIKSILILFFHLDRGLISGLFPSYFSTKTLCSSLVSHYIIQVPSI
jgi:hypothetical protein